MPSHTETRFLPHSPEELFTLVADVARYPEFLPWCLEAIIHEKTDAFLKADLIVGFSLFKDRFSSHVDLTPHSRIDVTYTQGPFQHLHNHWTFCAATLEKGDEKKEGCELQFFIDFEFKNPLFQSLMSTAFESATHRMMEAFQKRALEVCKKEDER